MRVVLWFYMFPIDCLCLHIFMETMKLKLSPKWINVQCLLLGVHNTFCVVYSGNQSLPSIRVWPFPIHITQLYSSKLMFVHKYRLYFIVGPFDCHKMCKLIDVTNTRTKNTHTQPLHSQFHNALSLRALRIAALFNRFHIHVCSFHLRSFTCTSHYRLDGTSEYVFAAA